MIKLAKGRDNSVMLKVSAAEPIESFSANLMICGTVKKIEKLSESGDRISFTASEIATALSVLGEDHFGTLLISDSAGDCRLKAQPQVNIVDVGDGEIPDSDQLICCSLPRKMVIAPDIGEGGGGTSTDLSNYVTKTVLNQTKEEVKQYTDSQIANVGSTVILEHPVSIIDKDGNTQKMTVQESMQNVVVVQASLEENTESINRISEKADSAAEAAAGAVEAAARATEAVQNTASDLEYVKKTVSEIEERYMVAEIKDEDDDGQPDAETLYINTVNR